MYRSETLTSLWGFGFVNIGELTFKSAAYVARYIMKKQGGKKAAETYSRVDTATGEIFHVKPPYSTMSRRPGIGKTWFDKYVTDVFPSDQVITNGTPALPPKFYDTQYQLLKGEAALEEIKKRRAKRSRKHASNNTPDRLAIREEVQIARTSHFKRNAN